MFRTSSADSHRTDELNERLNYMSFNGKVNEKFVLNVMRQDFLQPPKARGETVKKNGAQLGAVSI